MHIKIVRLERWQATRGIMLLDGDIFCCTLERGWKHNEVNVSCIPKGVYKASKYTSKTHGKTLQVVGVPNRTSILFHIGNTMEDSEGCILLGETFSRQQQAIRDSRASMLQFRELIVNETKFTVEIVNAA